MENNKYDKVAAVILAAGQGKRMQNDLPKVMHEVQGRPMIGYVMEAVEALGLSAKPIAVVNHRVNAVSEYLGDRADYAVQKELLGTGHAVSMAESLLKDKAEYVVVLYGDMPFIKSASVKRLVDEHLEKGNSLTFMTVTVPDFTQWRAQFYNFGRIIRAPSGQIVNIVERKDARDAELQITELITCHFCFKADWLWENLKKLENNNAQGEYYLTDLVRFAFKQRAKFSAIPLDPKEAMGINTQEDLRIATEIV